MVKETYNSITFELREIPISECDACRWGYECDFYIDDEKVSTLDIDQLMSFENDKEELENYINDNLPQHIKDLFSFELKSFYVSVQNFLLQWQW